MMHGCKAGSFRDLTRVFREGTLAGASDRLLLEQFVKRHDEAAFDALIHRHGPLVLNICRKLLRDRLDVEDAFQATFLVLVRKAGSLKFEESLAPWISTVAYRIAARARELRIRQNTQERASGQLPEVPAPPGESQDETSRVVYEELGRLPERLRSPIICCYLDGMTHEAAAAHLGCPVGTVRSRLARARARLQFRLARRGVSLADGASGMFLLRSGTSQVPAKLLRSTISLVLDSSPQTAGAGVASASILNLVEGVVSHMILRKAIILGSLLLPLGAILTAGVALALPQSDKKAKSASPREVQAVQQVLHKVAFAEDAIPKTYYVGDLIGIDANSDHSDDTTTPRLVPVIDLIRSTIAPGTWRIVDTKGNEILIQSNLGKPGSRERLDQERAIGAMIPFPLSVSLIIRHTAEVHDQIAKLFKFLRSFKAQNLAEFQRGPVAPAPSSAPDPSQQLPGDSRLVHKKRLKLLLLDLQREIDAMDQGSNRPTGTVEPSGLKN